MRSELSSSNNRCHVAVTMNSKTTNPRYRFCADESCLTLDDLENAEQAIPDH